MPLRNSRGKKSETTSLSAAPPLPKPFGELRGLSSLLIACQPDTTEACKIRNKEISGGKGREISFKSTALSNFVTATRHFRALK